jgi:DNA helicase-2/ATP-dependent DNA helicase PcrA
MAQNRLTEAQNAASLHNNGPALTLAIPGSGKTTLLLHRLINLVSNFSVKPSQIMTLTFSKASADDMAQRYKSQFGHLNHHFQFMTIHKFAYAVYRNYLKQTGKTMQLLDDGAQKFHILNEIYKKRHHDTLTEDDFETLTNHIGLIYNLKLTREDLPNFNFQWPDIFDITEDYHRYKRDHNLFDFDDMLLSAIKLLQKTPKLLDQVRNTYPYIQVDEAQDTSKLQFELIELLLGPKNNLFLVADDDQSIYGFRGAFPTYLLEFPSKYPEAKLYYLTENFRSDANIVETASAVISKNKQRFDKTMLPFHSATQKPVVRLFDDLTGRNDYLIEQIKNTEGTKAILFRNKVSSLSVIDSLERHNLTFQIKDAPLREFNHWMIEDLIAFFTLALIPQDLDSFTRIAYKMNGFISREMLSYVKANHRGRSVFSILVNAPFLLDYQTRTQERLQIQFETLKTLRPYDALHYIETELGYLDYIKSNSQRLGLSMNYARTRLDAFKAIAKPLRTGFDFINRISALKVFLQENFNNASESIILSTIHGSKGLEFDSVFMIDVNPQIFPGFKATESDALEEERRLFYVGMTRAKKSFELLHVEFINGSYNPNSLFIDELLSKPLTDRRFNNVTGKPAIG